MARLGNSKPNPYISMREKKRKREETKALASLLLPLQAQRFRNDQKHPPFFHMSISLSILQSYLFRFEVKFSFTDVMAKLRLFCSIFVCNKNGYEPLVQGAVTIDLLL